MEQVGLNWDEEAEGRVEKKYREWHIHQKPFKKQVG